MPKTAFIAGCFDGQELHLGHLYLLQEARKLPDVDTLLVAINHDVYLARKGPGRPLATQQQRADNLYRTKLVDVVLTFEDSPLEVIMVAKPDYIITGRSDYTPDQVVGAKECAAWGGQVVQISKDLGFSTTQIVNAKLNQSP